MSLYRQIFEQSPDALILVNLEGQIVDANAYTETLFGFDRTQLLGQPIEILIPAHYRQAHQAYRRRYSLHPTVRRMGASSVELYANRRDGSEFPADVMISPLQTDDQPLLMCAVRDVSQHQQAREELKRRADELEQVQAQLQLLASHDSLTGLLNRRTFQEQAEWLLRNCARRHEWLSVLMIDLDHFKRINDGYGHLEGDRALAQVGLVLHSCCRKNDVPARYGGEEFAVALPDTDAEGGVIVAEKLRNAIEQMTGLPESITASVGVVSCQPKPGLESASELYVQMIRHADLALYEAKRAGRNRVCHYHELHPRDPTQA